MFAAVVCAVTARLLYQSRSGVGLYHRVVPCATSNSLDIMCSFLLPTSTGKWLTSTQTDESCVAVTNYKIDARLQLHRGCHEVHRELEERSEQKVSTVLLGSDLVESGLSTIYLLERL